MCLTNLPHRLFEKQESIAIASLMQKNDPEWTYIPVHDPKGTGHSFIEIYDEEMEYLGKVV